MTAAPQRKTRSARGPHDAAAAQPEHAYLPPAIKKPSRHQRQAARAAATTTTKAPAPVVAQRAPTFLLLPPLPGHAGGCEHGGGRSEYTSEERDYLSRLTAAQRGALEAQIQASSVCVQPPLRFRVAHSRLPNKLDILHKLSARREGPKYEAWVESALRLPFNEYASMPRTNTPEFLRRARAVMDEEIYGQDALKDQTLCALCSWATNSRAGPLVLGLDGAPGVGAHAHAPPLTRTRARTLLSLSLTHTRAHTHTSRPSSSSSS